MKKLVGKLLNLSIGTKLTLTFIALIAITSIPLSFMVIRFSEKVYYERLYKSLIGSVRSEELQIRYYIINRDFWSLFKFVKGLMEKSPVSEAVVIDGKGHVLAHSNPQKYPIGSLYTKEGDINYPIVGLSSEIGKVILTLDKDSIKAEFKPIRFFLIASAVPFTGISFLLGLFISHRINSRLKKIKSSIKEVKKGNLENVKKVEFKEKDELQELSDFLYEIIQALKNYYENISYAQKFYMNILDTINELVFVVDKEDRIFYVNKKVESFGYKINNLIGLNIENIIENLEKENGNNSNYREVLLKLEGNREAIPMLMGTVAYEDWRIITLIDISERKKMEDKLKRAEILSRLGEMSVNFAHELKNAMLPLNLLSGVSEFSDDDIDVIKNSLTRINKLVNTFLNFAKPVPVEITKFNLSSVIEDILSIVESKARSKSIKFIKNVKDIEIKSSRDLLEIVLINLLLNAVEAIDDSGEVGVSAYIKEGELYIEVWDTGKGMREDEMKRVFEPFYTTKESGSGLGLSIVMKNIYLLGGSLELDSKPGKGTIFKLHIPLAGDLKG